MIPAMYNQTVHPISPALLQLTMTINQQPVSKMHCNQPLASACNWFIAEMKTCKHSYLPFRLPPFVSASFS
jgi:hypothetical protein